MRKTSSAKFDPTDRRPTGGNRLPALVASRHEVEVSEDKIPLAKMDRATKRHVIRVRAGHAEKDYRRVVDSLIYGWDLLAGMGFEE